MKLFIPTIGTKIVLTTNWKFTLFHEHRNKSIMEALQVSDTSKGFFNEYEPNTRFQLKRSNVSLPKGTILTVDRIYIRQNLKEYDSITFRVELPDGTKSVGVYSGYTKTKTKKKQSLRFWAKLQDVNKINYKLMV